MLYCVQSPGSVNGGVLHKPKRSFSSRLTIADVFNSSEAQEVSSPEHEEGIIPDSPVLPASFPVANKLKKHKSNNKIKHVCYTERPLPHSNNSLFKGQSSLKQLPPCEPVWRNNVFSPVVFFYFKELNKDPVGSKKNPERAEVLVPNTCELDASQILSRISSTKSKNSCRKQQKCLFPCFRCDEKCKSSLCGTFQMRCVRMWRRPSQKHVASIFLLSITW